eukprot:g21324.t1
MHSSFRKIGRLWNFTWAVRLASCSRLRSDFHVPRAGPGRRRYRNWSWLLRGADWVLCAQAGRRGARARGRLRARLWADGYLFLRGLLPSSAVQKARLSLLRGLQSLGLLAKDTPLEEGKAAPKSAGKAADATADSTGFHTDSVYMGRLMQQPTELLAVWIPVTEIPLEMGGLVLCRGSNSHPGFEHFRATYGRLDLDEADVGGSGWFTEDPREAQRSLRRGNRMHSHELLGIVFSISPVSETRAFGRQIIAFGGQMETAHFRPGDVVLFTMHSIHGSSVNCTDRYRLSMDFRVRAERVSDVEQSQKKGRWSRLRHDAAEFPRTMEEAKAAWKLLPSGASSRSCGADMRRDMRKELEEWRAAKGRTRGKENVPAPSSPCSPATPLTPRTPRQLPRELKKAHVLEFPRELSSREPRIGLSPTPLGERFATPPRHHAPPPAPALGAPVPRDPALGAAVAAAVAAAVDVVADALQREVPAAPPPSPREAKRNAGFHCTLPPSVLLAAVVAAFEEENKAQILEEAEKQLRTEEEELHDEHVALLDRLSRLQAEALSSGEEQATLRERFEEATRELQELSQRQRSQERGTDRTAECTGVRRHMPSWPTRTALDMEDHLSRAQDIFTFWFYEARYRARCALPRFRRSEDASLEAPCMPSSHKEPARSSLRERRREVCEKFDFEFGEQLGRGSFGVVFKVLRKEDAVTCVCKQIQLSEMKKKARLEANQEVELLRKVSRGCSYIVQYLGESDPHPRDEERSVWRYLLQIALGLQWLHQNRILHRDIKTLNVFLKTNDDVRLGDLGVARVLSGSNFANTFVGTPYYLSPEICEEKPYNELSDVWAFGCVVYEMCTLRHPFEAKNQAALLIKILRGQFAPIETRYTEESYTPIILLWPRGSVVLLGQETFLVVGLCQDLRELIDGCMQRELGKRTKLNDLLAGAAAQSWASRVEIAMQEPSGFLHRRPEKRLSPPTASGRATPQIPKAAAPRSRVRQDPRQNRRVEDAKVTLVAPKAKSDPRTLAPKDSARSKEDEARVLHAAEVAELPDVVMVAPRPSRNVVTVELGHLWRTKETE